MLERAMDAQNPESGSAEMREYEAFLFMFANTLLHETAHVLTTYLTRGKLDTPENVPSQVSISPEAAGEAGFKIEYFVFGGMMYYQYDPDHVTPNDTVCSYMVPWSEASPLKPMLIFTLERNGLCTKVRQKSLSSQARHN